ncbi:MAG: TPM domain-containing protein [Gemmatimonadota bacterium]|nr:TPM domain-containing protein [Gemmatimonadota bacterium]
MRIRFALVLALALPQRTPVGGVITKYVPPVPTPASFISDARGVLASDAHTALDAHIGSVQKAGLGDIAVAILPSIGDYSANQVAVEIYRTWKVGSVAAIGSARRDAGVLILMVPKELAPSHRGECWIETGTGVEGIIVDATAGSICRDSIIPHLRAKAYAAAVEAGVSGVEARLRADQGLAVAGAPAGLHSPIVQSKALAPTAPSSRLPFVFGGFGLVALLASIVGALEWRRSHRRKCPRCGRMMRRLDEAADKAKLDHGQDVEEQLGSVDYDVWECECGQTTVLPYRAWFSKYVECPVCHRRAVSHERTVLVPATTMTSGLAEDAFECKACGTSWTQQIQLPQIPVPSVSSSGGGDSSGGGGSSFGGSGSTSGGGGGGSY